MKKQAILHALLSCSLLSNIAFAQTEQAAAPAVSAPVDPKILKAQQAAEAKALKAAAAAEAKKQRELVRLYGMGPYPDEIDQYVATKPEQLRPLYKTLYTGGERNAVLNFERLGLAAIHTGNWKDAEWAFDKALLRIEAIYADNPQANAARSSFHNEANKDFKGEPYERAMAYYYRGLLYLRSGDYDNARASFKGAEYQDTLSDAETFQSDFAVMNYLVGWTQKCQGQESSAQESFALAAKTQEGLVAPAAGDNVLLIAELGNGPVKARSGTSEEMLVFAPGPEYPDKAAQFTLSPKAGPPKVVRTLPASSVAYQATTRGGRAIDGIMKGKASMKQTTNAIGDTAMQMGLQQGGNGGMAAMGIGLAFSLFSSAMKTKADIRAWDGLPDMINVATASAPSPEWTYAVSYMNGDAPADLSGGPIMRADAAKCSVVWTRSRALNPASADIIGEDVGVANAVSRKPPVMEKNKIFRASLMN